MIDGIGWYIAGAFVAGMIFVELRLSRSTPVGKYRKKPVVIDAWRLPMSDDASRVFDGNPNIIFKRERGAIVEAIITTREGVMIASNDDWIIRGVKGELYPCKPDIFAATYDAE